MIGEVAQGEKTTGAEAPTLPVQAKRTNGGNGRLRGDDVQNRTLTRMERRVLDTLLNPDLRDRTQDAICAAAQCSRTRYHEIMRDPWFQEQRRNLLKMQLQEHAATFVKAAVVTAATPGRDGFQDRRLLLTMTGDHVERRQHEHQVTGAIVVGVVGVSLDELG